MTNALVRKCNGCGRPFLKETGCNKMTCPFCLNKQCYVCSKTIADYDHFDNPRDTNPCPMNGDMKEFLEAQVMSAEDSAVKELLDQRLDLKEEDLRVDKRVKKEIKRQVISASSEYSEEHDHDDIFNQQGGLMSFHEAENQLLILELETQRRLQNEIIARRTHDTGNPL